MRNDYIWNRELVKAIKKELGRGRAYKNTYLHTFRNEFKTKVYNVYLNSSNGVRASNELEDKLGVISGHARKWIEKPMRQYIR